MAKTSTATEAGQEGSLREGLEAAIRERVREVIELILEEEVEAALGASRSQRVAERSGYRHGAKGRLRLSSKEQVDELFTKTVEGWARFYADPKPTTLNAQNLVSRRRFALEMLEARVPPGSKILDVGCGTGQLAAELTRRGYEAWAVDLSEAMVRYAREHYDPDRFRVGDIERIPFPDNTFDGVMCLGVMEYLSSNEPALREMWRVLKPGGRAVVTTPSSTCPFYHMDRAFEKVRFLARPLVRFLPYRLRRKPLPPSNVLPAVTHCRYYRRRWLKLMRSMGLEAEDWACHSWGWYSLERFFNQGAFCRASDRFARNPLLNWLASDQLACVRAIK